MIRLRDLLALAATAAAPWILPAAVILIGAALLGGISCGARQGAEQAAHWERVAVELAQDNMALWTAKRASDAALAAERARTDSSAAVAARQDTASRAEIAEASARIDALTGGSAAVRAELARIQRAYDALALKHAAYVVQVRHERGTTDRVLLIDSLIIENTEAQRDHERQRPGAPRLAYYADAGYAVAVDTAGSGSAPYGALGARLRLTQRAALHARADVVFPPVQQLRAVAFLHIEF